jgi:transcriptional regulator with XRE-family HTH domain
MPGVRRSTLAVEATRRHLEQRIRIGGEIQTMRERRGWTRTELATRAGIGRMVESRVERGGNILEAPADAGHLAIQELIFRLGRAAGYEAAFELPTRAAEPWRSVDVGLASAARHDMILVECWNTFGDVGAAARSTNRKHSDLEDLATGRWGTDARVGVVWVIRSTARNRALLQRYPEVFSARFPASSRDWVAALTVGEPLPTQAGLVWCDVGATRIFEWRRR